MHVIISGFISAGNISQQFFHAFNCFFRGGDPDLLSLSKYPRVECIAQRNGDDDLGVSLIVVRDHDIAAKSINNQIHVVIDEDQRDIPHITAVHGECVIRIIVDVGDCLVCFLPFPLCQNNACRIHLINAEVFHLRLAVRVIVGQEEVVIIRIDQLIRADEVETIRFRFLAETLFLFLVVIRILEFDLQIGVNRLRDGIQCISDLVGLPLNPVRHNDLPFKRKAIMLAQLSFQLIDDLVAGLRRHELGRADTIADELHFTKCQILV